MMHPHDYVIKPQKEGGGNNYYGEKVKEMLVKAQTDKDALEDIRKYLIMEKINPPRVHAYMLRKGKLIGPVDTLQELGIYSSLFINVSKDAELVNEHNTFGKLIRTKGTDSDEGGVVAGFSVVDQPFLTKDIGPLSPHLLIKPLVSDF